MQDGSGVVEMNDTKNLVSIIAGICTVSVILVATIGGYTITSSKANAAVPRSEFEAEVRIMKSELALIRENQKQMVSMIKKNTDAAIEMNVYFKEQIFYLKGIADMIHEENRR